MDDIIEIIMDIGLGIFELISEGYDKKSKSKRINRFKVAILIIILIVLICTVTFLAIKFYKVNIIYSALFFILDLILILGISSIFKKILDREI